MSQKNSRLSTNSSRSLWIILLSLIIVSIIFIYATADTDVEACNKLQTFEEHIQCFTEIMDPNSLHGYDCMEPDDDNAKVNCYTAIARTLQEPAVCSHISNLDVSVPLIEFGDCIDIVASVANNVELCKFNPDEWKLDYCIEDVAISNEALEKCKLIDDQRMVEPCMRQIAVDTNNITICNNLQEDYVRDSCLATYGRLNNNIDVCTVVVNDRFREVCIKEIAFQTDNISLCDFIADVEYKDTCIKSVQDGPSFIIHGFEENE